jgi:large subunit ribosomal protein L31
MKEKIHPTFYPDAKVTCACGNTFTTGSIMKELYTEVCNQCHPFFTGKQKLLDTAGSIDKFKKRAATAAKRKSEVKPKKERKARVKK